MGKVVAGFAMSLDGFIADTQDGVHPLFDWLFKGDTAFPIMGQVFMTSPTSAAHYRELLDATGAQVTGRRDFDVSRAWGGCKSSGSPHVYRDAYRPSRMAQRGITVHVYHGWC